MWRLIGHWTFFSQGRLRSARPRSTPRFPLARTTPGIRLGNNGDHLRGRQPRAQAWGLTNAAQLREMDGQIQRSSELERQLTAVLRL